MANDKQGTVHGLPFASADGKPKQVTGGKPTNLGQPPHTGSDAGRGGDRNFTGESRRMRDTPTAPLPAPNDPIARGNRPQTPSTPAARVSPTSITPDGAVDLSTFTVPAYRRTTGTPGGTRMPWKNMK